MTGTTNVDVDVVVVGAGAGGLAAALAVADQGKSVVVLEKLERMGGNSALSTGSIPAAGSRLQIEAGVEDSAERMAADLLAQSGPHEAEHLTRVLSAESGSLVDWLVDTHHVDLLLIKDYKHVGHSVHRLHAPPSRRGADLVRDMARACDLAGIDILLSNPVKELITDGDAVVGVVVAGDRLESYEIRCNSVILASNGFAANKDLVNEWLPAVSGVEYFGAHGSTGEALQWGLEQGGYLQNIGAYQGYAAVAYPHGSILSWTTIEMGAVLVTEHGGRVGDESIGYSGFAQAVADSGLPCFVVFDARIRDHAAKEEEFAELIDSGGVREFNSIAELAGFIGADEADISRTLESYASAARRESEDAFGRQSFGMAPLAFPLCVSRVTPGVFHTQGGLAVDDHGHVLRSNGDVVSGLFAVGGVAAGISGQSGGRGYSSGNGLLAAAGLGRLAGIAASQTA